MVRKNVLIYEVNLISHLQQQLLKYGKLAEVPLYIYYHYLWLQTPLRWLNSGKKSNENQKLLVTDTNPNLTLS